MQRNRLFQNGRRKVQNLRGEKLTKQSLLQLKKRKLVKINKTIIIIIFVVCHHRRYLNTQIINSGRRREPPQLALNRYIYSAT